MKFICWYRSWIQAGKRYRDHCNFSLFAVIYSAFLGWIFNVIGENCSTFIYYELLHKFMTSFELFSSFRQNIFHHFPLRTAWNIKHKSKIWNINTLAELSHFTIRTSWCHYFYEEMASIAMWIGSKENNVDRNGNLWAHKLLIVDYFMTLFLQ